MKIGFGVADITPAGKVALQGQFNVRVAEGIHSRLYTTAMATETEGKLTVWASVDLLHIMPPVPDMAAERIARKISGFTADDLAVSATHTHTAPYVGREQECMLCSFKAEEKLYEDLNYLPTPDAMKRGGYSAVIFACQCAADAGEVLVSESIDLVREKMKK